TETYTLHEMRKRSGVSGAKAAELCNISYQGLRNWETGAHIPNIVAVVDLLSIYGYTMNQLDLSPFYKENQKPNTHPNENDLLALERLNKMREQNTQVIGAVIAE